MPKDKSATPMIADITFDKEPIKETKTPPQVPEVIEEIPAPPDNVKVDRNGQWRDATTGQLVPGTPGNRNAGRPKRLQALDKFLKGECGENMESILKRLVTIATYDPDQTELDKDGKEKKKSRHYYSAGHQVTAIQMIMAYYFGKPMEQKVVDINKNVKVEGKLTSLTALVSKHANKIKDIKNVTPKPIDQKIAQELLEEEEEDMITDA